MCFRRAFFNNAENPELLLRQQQIFEGLEEGRSKYFIILFNSVYLLYSVKSGGFSNLSKGWLQMLALRYAPEKNCI